MNAQRPRVTVTFGPRKAPESLRPARLDGLQADVFAALLATLPEPAANENGGGR